jgi:hypothetical protein
MAYRKNILYIHKLPIVSGEAGCRVGRESTGGMRQQRFPMGG